MMGEIKIEDRFNGVELVELYLSVHWISHTWYIRCKLAPVVLRRLGFKGNSSRLGK